VNIPVAAARPTNKIKYIQSKPQNSMHTHTLTLLFSKGNI